MKTDYNVHIVNNVYYFNYSLYLKNENKYKIEHKLSHLHRSIN